MANEIQADTKCRWGNGHRCQFEDSETTHEFQGRHYCRVHAPIEDPLGLAGDELQRFIDTQTSVKHGDFSGIVMRRAKRGSFDLGSGEQVILRECQLGDGVQLVLHGAARLDGAVAVGNATIVLNAPVLRCRNATFRGHVSFHCNAHTLLDITCTKFLGEAEFQSAQNLKGIDARDCKFSRAIALPAAKELPQETTFQRAWFDRRTAFGPGTEARYRAIRNLLNKNRDREQEGMFYSYEKRALRYSMGWGLRAWLPRSLSALYDWMAAYGQSYERALAWFAGAQVVFGLIYSALSCRLHVPGEFDSQVAAFTLAQVVKPFELLAARDFSRWPYQDVYQPDSGGLWVLITTAHSIASLGLVALFLLALRWRFRRD